MRSGDRGLNERAKVLCVTSEARADAALVEQLQSSFDVEVVHGAIRALARLARDEFAAVYVGSGYLQNAFELGKLLQNERILEGMPDGVVLLDADRTIIWGNQRLRKWCGRSDIVGINFYTALGSPDILGPDFCPFHTALATGQPSSSVLRMGDNRYFQVHAAPVIENGETTQHLIVTVRDVTLETLQQQKLAAIHQAGVELADLTPDELRDMSIEDRIELLKSNILHYTKDLLDFDVVEIRLLDPKTKALQPLLAVGMEPSAMSRELHAEAHNNGVTGFVAATGKSYLCEDTMQDPLYLEGAKGAKSSLTVPLILHEQVIGTFNVESPEPRAFTESDLQFLEIFSRDVAASVNTLELLVAEKASTAAKSVEAIHSAVALPVDDILNDAVNIMERYIGHEPEVVERLQRILRNARDIKQVIQKVGQNMAPSTAHPETAVPERPLLHNRLVLVVDEDDSVRSAAHALLERYGCIVETAHDAGEATYMIRNLGTDSYDCIIADIRLPDMNGYNLMCRLQTMMDHVPLVLMTGFGYDPGHSVVKARQAGLKAVLYKPFRLDQLLEAVETVVTEQPVRQQS